MTEHLWKVVPLSHGQRLDVRPEDVIADGHFRRCETYRGGGGYDQFPLMFERRYGWRPHVQFIVQLFGCNLDCPYCYVTRAGVWGQPVKYTTKELVLAFREAQVSHACEVFHLMGGAPALQLKYWQELIETLPAQPFHSDLLLSEADYSYEDLLNISQNLCLYAVDIKGLSPDEHLRNTRKPFNEKRMWDNLEKLEAAGVPYYFTFTSIDPGNRDRFEQQFSRRFGTVTEGFGIELIDYAATAHVDDVPWGKQK